MVPLPPAPARGDCTLILSALSIGGEPVLMAPAGEAAREAKSVSPVTALAVAASPRSRCHTPGRREVSAGRAAAAVVVVIVVTVVVAWW